MAQVNVRNRNLNKFDTTKTKSSDRTIKFGGTLYAVLKKEKNRQNKNRLLYGEYYTEHYLSPEKDEKGNTIYRIMPGERTLKSPLKKVDLPHTHATVLIENGANPKDVQARLGHANISTPLQTYTHDTEEMQNQSVDIFEHAVLKYAHQ